MIGIIDYGMGNLRSVQKALEHIDAQASIIDQPRGLDDCSAAILPGVGAFRDAISELNKRGFADATRQFADSGRPILGICLGMQLFFDVSEEEGRFDGLGLIAGDVVRFEPEQGLKIPHMGWNALESRANPTLLQGLSPSPYVYFVHSYHVRPTNPEVITSVTRHGTQEFVSTIAQGNIFATQFHPEKSQRVGLKILQNFAALAKSTVGEPG